jgi:hypothetical protein
MDGCLPAFLHTYSSLLEETGCDDGRHVCLSACDMWVRCRVVYFVQKCQT